MNRTHFIYCPQSGPQWIGEAEPRDCDSVHDIPMAVPAVVWENRSVHVYGTGLSWEPQSRAWRAEAGKLLEALAVEAGGVAWDNRGQLCIVVPSYLAGDIDEAVESVRGLSERGIARTFEQRRYEIEGAEYWAARIRARRSQTPRQWHASLEIADRAGDVLQDTKTPASRYTTIRWWEFDDDTIEVGAPWEPSYLGGAKEAPEMYPQPVAAVCTECGALWAAGAQECVECGHWEVRGIDCRGAKERLPFRPQLPDHVLDSRRYQETRS